MNTSERQERHSVGNQVESEGGLKSKQRIDWGHGSATKMREDSEWTKNP